MSAITQSPIGHGRIVWLGINQERGKFSLPRNTLTIHEDGIEDDMYRSMWRKISGHDVDYIATDGVTKGELVLNMRQITIVDKAEVKEAGLQSDVIIEHGMLRENLKVSFTSINERRQFSELPPLSRMVIGNKNPKVLILTEENGPCRTICNPMSVYYNGDVNLADLLRKHLEGRRGQMAMVRSFDTKDVQIGDSFTIFPPMI
jgi:hypothetical protein